MARFDVERLKLAAAELARREKSAIRMWEPLPAQEEFHASDAWQKVAFGSNRSGKSLPNETPVLTPNGWQAIGSLRVGDVVIGGDGNPCLVSGVFPQGELDVYELEFSDGTSIECSLDHLWKVHHPSDRFGKNPSKWSVLSLEEIRALDGDNPRPIYRVTMPECIPWMPRRRIPVDPYVLGVVLGDGGLTQGVVVSSKDDETIEAVRDALPDGHEIKDSDPSRSHACDYRVVGPGGKNLFMDSLRQVGVWGKLSWEKEVPWDYLFNSADVRLAVLQGLMDTDGTVGKAKGKGRSPSNRSFSYSTTSPYLADAVAFLVRSLGGRASFGKWKRKSYRNASGERILGRESVNVSIRLDTHCPFRLKRKAAEWEIWKKSTKLRPAKVLKHIRKSGRKPCTCISVSCPDKTFVAKDLIVTHNTAAGSWEVAAHALKQQKYNNRFTSAISDLRIACVGLKTENISEVFYRKLCLPGAFHCIRDELTGEPRAYRPFDPKDVARKEERFPAPPLLPPEVIKDIAWADKAKGVFKKITLNNGTEIMAYTGGSNSNPPQGMDLDIVWFDEEIDNPAFYPELSARLLDRNGLFVWTATPQNASVELFNLYQDARDGSRVISGRPLTECFKLTLDGNPHIDDHQKEILKAKFEHDAEAYAVRVEGDFAIEGHFVFGDWNKEVHGWSIDDHFEDGKVPDNWSRYMIVDPGHTKCAVLFLAVPDPSSKYGDMVLAYDELYMDKCIPEMFGNEVALKVGNDVFQEFIIDAHGGKNKGLSGLASPITAYSEQLHAREIASAFTGSGFTYGDADIKGRVSRARQWLYPSPKRNGFPRLRVDLQRCPNFVMEIERYTKKKINGVVYDEPDDKKCGKYNHLMHCFQYAAAHGCPYIRPVPPKKDLPKIFRAYQEWQEMEEAARAAKMPDYFSLGPNTSDREEELSW